MSSHLRTDLEQEGDKREADGVFHAGKTCWIALESRWRVRKDPSLNSLQSQ